MPSAAVRLRRLATAAAAGAVLAAALVATPGAVSGPAALQGSDALQLRAAPAIRLTVPSTAAAGTQLRLTGAVVVRRPGGAAKARIVRLSERRGGSWRLVARTRSTRAGAFVFRVAAGSVAATRSFRVDAPAVPGLPLVRTGSVRIVVTATGSGLSSGKAPSAGDLIKPEALPTGYAAAGSSTDWTYLFRDRKTFYGSRWDPCQVIRWSYNPTGQGYGAALADVARAFAKIAGVSGLQFQYVGRTAYRYLGAASADGFPDTTDLVVSWANQQEMPDLGPSGPSDPVGIGGGSGYTSDTPGADVDIELTQGYLTLDKAAGVPLAAGFGGKGWGQVMMHEILHALGLGHAQGDSQLMNPTATSKNFRFGAGDITGMRKVGVAPGSSGCLSSAPDR